MPTRAAATAAAAAAATAAAAGAGAASAPAAGSATTAAAAPPGRGNSNNPRRTTAASTHAAAAAAVDSATATEVPLEKTVQDLDLTIELGVARTPVLDAGKVVLPSGTILLHMTDDDISIQGMQLAGCVPAVAGTPDFGSVTRTLRASGSVSGGVGTALYKRKVGLDPVARCLLTLALSVGALRVTTKGYYILPSRDELTRRASPGPVGGGAPAAMSAATFQEAVSRQVAVCLAGQVLGSGASADVGAAQVPAVAQPRRVPAAARRREMGITILTRRTSSTWSQIPSRTQRCGCVRLCVGV